MILLGKGNRTRTQKAAASSVTKKSAMNKGTLSIILTLCICVAILVGVIIYANIAKTAGALNKLTTMTVGDTKIGGTEFEYKYNETILAFKSNYSDLLSYLDVDFDEDLSTQYISTDQSWKDYFISSTASALKEQYLLCNEAASEGYELSEEDKASALSDLETMKTTIESYGWSFDSYLQTYYGQYLTPDELENYTLSSALYYSFYKNVLNSFDINDTRIQEYYESNKDTYDTATFRSYQFTYTVPTTDETATDNTSADTSGTDAADETAETEDTSYKDEARAKAEAALAAITDEASFETYILSVMTDEEKAKAETDFTLNSEILKSAVATAVGDWLFDDARQEGDTTIIEANNGFFVVYFKSCGLNSYDTVAVRHILLQTSTVDKIYVEGSTEEVDEEATAAAQEAADAEVYAKAEEILNEWLAGDKTEDSFAALADEKSDDTTEGGLYKEFAKGTMPTEFNDWSFDPARQVGDYSIIKTSYGYHIVYFSGYTAPYWKLQVKSKLQSSDYSEYLTSLEEKYPVVLNEAAMKKVD